MLAIIYEIKNTNNAGYRGVYTVSLVGLRETIMMYAITVLPTEIVILPRKVISAPIPFTVMKLPECFKAKTKADIALEQKPLPVRQT